jgi:hypothetical protein
MRRKALSWVQADRAWGRLKKKLSPRNKAASGIV